MCRIKYIILVLLFLLFYQKGVSQKIVYVSFDNSSKEMYDYEIGNGQIGKEKIYIKEFKKNQKIYFYIKKELFESEEIDTCKIEYLKNIKVSDLSTLKKEVNRTNPLYPYKVFPNLYLVEKINDSLIVKYKVKWEYYIE